MTTPESVVVSSYFINSISLIVKPIRVFGLMPYKYYTNKYKNQIEFSSNLATYGIFFVIFLSFAVTAGVTSDIINPDTTRLNNPLDKYVALVEIGALIVCLWFIYISFIVQRRAALQMSYYLTQVDQVLNLRDISWARKQAKRLMVLVFCALLLLLLYTHCVWIFVVRNKLYTLSFSAGYYISQTVIICMLSMYWIVCNSIAHRIVGLQKELKHCTSHQWRVKLTSRNMVNMNSIYQNIFSSLTALSTAFGPMIFATMTTVVISLIANLYVIIQQAIYGQLVALRIMEVLWFSFHIGRLILIVEPSHRLNKGLEYIRVLTAKLLSFDVDEDTNLQIETFSTQILLSPDGAFSPFGMINVNRGVFITVLGSVSTYVVLILNFKKSD